MFPAFRKGGKGLERGRGGGGVHCCAMGDENLPTLNPGDMIKQQYAVVKKLGEGGFGAVYLVEHAQTRKKAAMKIESATEQIQVLKMEVVVLKELMERGGKHVCQILDRGRNDSFNYVIMTLVGQSLQDLRKACPQSHFTLSSAIRVGIQCLEATMDLHRLGYLHRDIKPGNFAIGREEEGTSRVVYILDFGLARKFVNDRGEIRTPRAAAGFRGTVRYAPLNCHNSRELSRRDDLETWFYQQIEITRGKVPWAQVQDKDEVGRYKVRARQTGELIQECPRGFGAIISYIDGLKYWDVPDYDFIFGTMRQELQRAGGRDSDPYDWEKGGQHRGRTQMLPAAGYNPHQDAPIVNF